MPVAVLGERGDVAVALGLEGFGQHPQGAFADDFVD
jgi:hypothetical protein